ncbi:MAG: ATP-binding cassette domain-containing protein [Deltaproteobacteria bacterium]|nr:ATP-binding cassette domain-containing protein [Deltaproteobacteria bacterium]
MVANDLAKHYRVHRREAGISAALRSLFARRFETIRAVDGISFAIDPGERVGFLGPNGAGKTTTIKMMAGLLHPTTGTVTVAGHRPAARHHDFLRAITLVAGQKQQLFWDLPPVDTFELNRAIYDVPRAEYRQRLDELVGLLEIESVMQKPTRQLSLGERMKCELAAALIHRPALLFLDEPTIGLDIAMQATIRRFIADYNARHGASVLLTSHYMADVAALCPRVIVIDHGTIIYDGTLEALAQQLRPEKRIELRLTATANAPSAWDCGDRGRIVEREGTRIVIQAPQGVVKEILAQAIDELPINDLTVADAPLEEVLGALFDKAAADRQARDPDQTADTGKSVAIEKR